MKKRPSSREFMVTILVMVLTIWFLTAIDAGTFLWIAVVVIVALVNGVTSSIARDGGWL